MLQITVRFLVIILQKLNFQQIKLQGQQSENLDPGSSQEHKFLRPTSSWIHLGSAFAEVVLRGSTAVADPRPHVLALQHCRTVSHAMARLSAVETHLGRGKSSDSVSGTQNLEIPASQRLMIKHNFVPRKKQPGRVFVLCHQTVLCADKPRYYRHFSPSTSNTQFDESRMKIT